MPYVSMIEQRGIDKGLQEGLQQGVQEGLRAGIRRLLTSRFGQVPPQVAESLTKLDRARLEELTVLAATALSLEAFQAELG